MESHKLQNRDDEKMDPVFINTVFQLCRGFSYQSEIMFLQFRLQSFKQTKNVINGNIL